MWTRWWRSRVLLIRIKKVGAWGMVLPISLVAIEQLLAALLDLVDFLGPVLPGRALRIRWRVKGAGGADLKEHNLYELLEMLRAVWDELRSYGQWQLVAVESEDVRVDIRFF